MNGRMFDIRAYDLLPDTVLVHGEILPAQVWDEESIFILYQELERNHVGGGIELDFGPLLILRALEERGARPARDPKRPPASLSWCGVRLLFLAQGRRSQEQEQEKDH